MPFMASSILLAVDALPSGGWLLGVSDGWSQNPEGLSSGGNGMKLLFTLNTVDAAPSRYDLTPGPRHNEVRTAVADSYGRCRSKPNPRNRRSGNRVELVR